MTSSPTDVTDYIASLEDPERALVAALYERARRLVPEAEEGRSYGMAALRHRGRPLVAVVVGAKGLTAYPFSSDVVAQVMATSSGLTGTKGGIKFSLDDPIPDAAFDALVRGRLSEIER